MKARQFIASVAVLLTAATAGIGAQASAVADAAMKGDVAAVRALIQKKTDVNAPQVDGATALHWAVYRGEVELTDALLQAGANPKAANRTGTTPLAMATLYGHPRIVDLLLKSGAEANERGPNGETMLMFAAKNGNPDVIRLLVAAGADVNARESVRGTTALMWAAEQRHPEAVKALLAAGADHSAKSGPAGLPRNYMAQRVNTRVVEEAQQRRERAKAAGRTYEEQLEWEEMNGLVTGGRGGSPGGPVLPGQTGARGAGARGAGASGGAQPQAAPAGGQQAAPAAAEQGAPPARQQPEASGAQPAPAAPSAAPGPQAAQGTPTQGGRGRGGAGAAGRAGGAGGAGQQRAGDDQAAPEGGNDDTEVVVAGLTGSGGGGLTALTFAAREGDLESAQALIEAGADVNLRTTGGWTPLLTAINNRNYRLAAYLLERGADPNIPNERFGWTPLYLATDNRNIEGGDYPVPRPDMDHLELIKLLLDKGANVNATIQDNTLTRTIFTMQWFFEAGATAFNRAAQSSDTALMKLLLEYGADPKTRTAYNDTALTLAGGIGWVDGVTYERSPAENLEAVRMLLDLGLDPNAANNDGRTALMGAALKGRNDVVKLLVERGARLDQKDRGSRDTHHAATILAGHTWQALDYADGLVRVGVQSATARPETATLIRTMMKERGMPVPPENRTIQSICVTDICAGLP
jgi:ankyrin repeat protein